MKSIQVQLTTKCNQRCFMCRKYTWKQKEININILKEKIEKYKDCTFTFSGGDPLEYSHLEELNNILIENMIHYQIFTNMNYILSEEQKRFLDNAEFIQVSFDGATEATYNSVRRPKANGIDVVISNIEYYSEKIKVNCTVSKRNYFEVKEIYNLLSKVLDIRFFPVHTDEDAKLEPWMIKHIQDQFAFFKPISIINFLKAKDRKEFDGKCFIKNEHRLIDEDGKEYPCCRAINDNGEDWDGKNCVENLKALNDENVLYDFCKDCDRYRKFNENWNDYKDKEKVYL